MSITDQNLMELTNSIIEESKKRGSVSVEALFDRLDKVNATPQQIEDVYKALDAAEIQVINEYERDKDL